MQTRTHIFAWLAGLFIIGLLFIGLFRTKPQLHQQQFYVFGTLVSVSIWGVPEQQAHEAINMIASDFQTMHQNWHAWHPSQLTDLNQSIANGKSWTISDPSLLFMLKKAKDFYKQSDGLFNPAIGQLINLWGFQTDGLLPDSPPPTSAQISQLVALAPNMNNIAIKGNQISSHNQAVQLDLGAFAKGYAIDLAIEKLKKQGIHHAIINAGGNLKAIGQKAQKPWLIGILHPSGQGVLAAVTISGEESVITSGNYERFREYQNIRYSHIIDPRNGMPSQDLTSVTVIDKNGIVADAAATALMVAGLPDWHRIAQQMGLKYVMLVDEAGTIHANPAMAARLQFPSKPAPKIEIIEEFLKK
jgi:thiamine biosynthesis lipoprotein